MSPAILSAHITRGEHHSTVTNFFDFQQLDAFHHPEVLRVIYGESWYSVFVTQGESAMLHVFCPQPLPATTSQPAQFDIEPFIGYNGPVLNTTDLAFREVALLEYSRLARERGVIAEIIRFSPILHNSSVFEGSAQLQVFRAKDIVVTPCYADAEAQLAAFTAKCRSSVRRGLRDCTTEVLDKAYWSDFVAFYYASLDRLNAECKWYYSPELFARAEQSDFFQVYVVKYQGQWASVSLVIDHPLAGYYFVAASSEVPVQGANEYLVHSIAVHLAQKGIEQLILGGGNTASDDDPLLRFKRKFAHEPTSLVMGKIVHDKPAFSDRIADALAHKPELTEVNFFLKYRLL